MKLKKKPYILIVGSGILGAYLSKLLINKDYNIIVTSRKLKKSYYNYKKLKITKKVRFEKLNIQNDKEIEKILTKYNPKNIYYFAGQSSIMKSKKLQKSTYDSNYLGAKKFLNIIFKKNLKIKFFKANTGYIFKSKNKKINLKCNLIKPNNPYVYSQIKAYNLVKYYRQAGLQCYSLIFFNIESLLRPKEYFIKKICHAVKKEIKVNVGNIYNIRDFAWAPEIMNAVSHLHKIKPCDIILATGKGMSGEEVIKYLYNLKKLNYKNYIKVKKNLFRKNEEKSIVASISDTLRKLKKFNWKPKIYGKKLVYMVYKNI